MEGVESGDGVRQRKGAHRAGQAHRRRSRDPAPFQSDGGEPRDPENTAAQNQAGRYGREHLPADRRGNADRYQNAGVAIQCVGLRGTPQRQRGQARQGRKQEAAVREDIAPDRDHVE